MTRATPRLASLSKLPHHIDVRRFDPHCQISHEPGPYALTLLVSIVFREAEAIVKPSSLPPSRKEIQVEGTMLLSPKPVRNEAASPGRHTRALPAPQISRTQPPSSSRSDTPGALTSQSTVTVTLAVPFSRKDDPPAL
ncbi:hypothetical protein AVEN_213275-1 [Araneus ventricosus]|uniref:Uncharacterized protein n=1 Tax=Araneus ventricosus TaxID=182803 RepID=A0A4Y2DDP4_ARAVE|nr:hypothetical protein AVEN_213275-1 [Araneus ventricosus]